MTPPLAVLFAQHKAAFLGAGAAGVAGLALLQRRKATAGGPSKSTPAGTIPAAAVVPASGVQGAYPDTSSTDMYNQLEGQLERLQAGQGSQAVPVPTPVASTLFAPSGSGQYVRYGSSIAEVESDGSLFAPTYSQWLDLHSKGANFTDLSAKDADIPKYFSTAGNLAAKNTATP